MTYDPLDTDVDGTIETDKVGTPSNPNEEHHADEVVTQYLSTPGNDNEYELGVDVPGSGGDGFPDTIVTDGDNLGDVINNSTVGEYIYVEAGTYRFSQHDNNPAEGVTLHMHEDATVLPNSSTGLAEQLIVPEAEDVTILGGFFDMEGSNYEPIELRGDRNRVGFSQFTNMSSGTYACNIYKANDCVIHNTHTYNVASRGPTITGNPTDSGGVYAENCFLTDNVISGVQENGIKIRGARNCAVTGNNIQLNNDGVQGIRVANVDEPNQRNLISGNTIEVASAGATETGILCGQESDGTSEYNFITSNTISCSDYAAIWVRGTGVLASNNFLDGDVVVDGDNNNLLDNYVTGSETDNGTGNTLNNSNV